MEFLSHRLLFMSTFSINQKKKINILHFNKEINKLMHNSDMILGGKERTQNA